jgi:hypothetical protein
MSSDPPSASSPNLRDGRRGNFNRVIERVTQFTRTLAIRRTSSQNQVATATEDSVGASTQQAVEVQPSPQTNPSM